MILTGRPTSLWVMNDIFGNTGDVAYTPNNGSPRGHARSTLSATCGLMQCTKEHPYSITSSASNCILLEMATPSVLAVFRLITSSNLVD